MKSAKSSIKPVRSKLLVVSLTARILNEPLEKTISRFKKAGLTEEDMKGEKISLKRLQQIFGSDSELKKAAQKIFVKEVKKDSWQIVPVSFIKGVKKDSWQIAPPIKITGALPVLTVQPTSQSSVSQNRFYSLSVQPAIIDQHIIDSFNTFNRQVGEGFAEVLISLEKHNEPLNILAQLQQLRRFLPFTHYFDSHSIGTDLSSKAAVITHMDFEAKGRAGLDFKLGRIYSSLTASSMKGGYLIRQQVRPYYEYLNDIIDGIEKATNTHVFDYFCSILSGVDTIYGICLSEYDYFLEDFGDQWRDFWTGSSLDVPEDIQADYHNAHQKIEEIKNDPDKDPKKLIDQVNMYSWPNYTREQSDGERYNYFYMGIDGEGDLYRPWSDLYTGRSVGYSLDSPEENKHFKMVDGELVPAIPPPRGWMGNGYSNKKNDRCIHQML